MTDLAAMREGLKANLDAITGVQVSAYRLAQFTPPTIWVLPAEVEYDQAMGRGHDLYTFRVQVITGSPTDIGAQKHLERFLAPSGASSVKEACESDQTLGGAAYTVRVSRSTGERVATIEGRGQMLVAEFTVEVRASGA